MPGDSKTTLKDVLSFIDVPPSPQVSSARPYTVAVWNRRISFAAIRFEVSKFREEAGDRLLNEHVLRVYSQTPWFVKLGTDAVVKLFDDTFEKVCAFILSNYVSAQDMADARHAAFVLDVAVPLVDDKLLNVLIHMRRRLLRWRLLAPKEEN
jgi:hypothetical protein